MDREKCTADISNDLLGGVENLRDTQREEFIKSVDNLLLVRTCVSVDGFQNEQLVAIILYHVAGFCTVGATDQ